MVNIFFSLYYIMSTPTYNKMASIAIGGTNINKVSTPNGNASLDVTGQTNLRNNLYVGGNITNSTADMTISTTGAGKKLNLSTYNDMNVNSNGDMYLTGASVNFTSSTSGVGFTSASNVSFYSAGNIYYQTSTTGGGTNFIINNYDGNAGCMISTIPGNTDILNGGGALNISNTVGTGTNNITISSNGTIQLTKTSINGTLNINGEATFQYPIIPSYSYSGLVNTKIGFQSSATTATAISNGGSWTALCNTGNLPAGIWQIECHNSFTYSTTSHYRAFSISTGGATTIDTTRYYLHSQNSGGNLDYGMNTTFVLTGTTTVYFMGQLPTTGGTVTNPYNFIRWTRIG